MHTMRIREPNAEGSDTTEADQGDAAGFKKKRGYSNKLRKKAGICKFWIGWKVGVSFCIAWAVPLP